LEGARGRGTLAKEKTPIFGMLPRTVEVMIRLLEDVQQVTMGPLIKQSIAEGSVVYMNEYDIYSRLFE
jgi:transposase